MACVLGIRLVVSSQSRNRAAIAGVASPTPTDATLPPIPSPGPTAVPKPTPSPDGTACTDTAVAPGPQYGVGLAFDEATGQLVAFGGTHESSVGGPDQSHLASCSAWRWDAGWHRIPSSAAPSARSFPLMAFDPPTHLLVMYGGGGPNLDAPKTDTWTWDGAQWTEWHPVSVPTQFTIGAATASTPDGVVILNSDELWRWSSGQWVKIGAAPETHPFGMGLAYDASSRELVAFGGQSGPGQNLRDTWTWSGSAWSRLEPVHRPSGGLGALAFDGLRQQLVWYGADGTWAWTGSDWLQSATPAQSPSWDYWGSLVYDPALGADVLYGQKGSIEGQVWQWDGMSWTKLS